MHHGFIHRTAQGVGKASVPLEAGPHPEVSTHDLRDILEQHGRHAGAHVGDQFIKNGRGHAVGLAQKGNLPLVLDEYAAKLFHAQALPRMRVFPIRPSY